LNKARESQRERPRDQNSRGCIVTRVDVRAFILNTRFYKYIYLVEENKDHIFNFQILISNI